MLCKKFLLFTITILLSAYLFAQKETKQFEKEWKEIDSLIEYQMQPKSALEKVNIMYQRALGKDIADQQIKCLIYKINLENIDGDENPTKKIETLQAEIDIAYNAASKAILNGLIAQAYQHYFEANRWKFYDRNKTTNYLKEDITTWSADDFFNIITSYYLKSLKAAERLQQVDIATFSAIIQKGNASHLRPTLYDLLAHNALDYFKTGEHQITKPANPFIINDPKVFLPSAQFTKASFSTKDSSSPLIETIKLFQQLMALHLARKDTAAYLTVDLERITWAKQVGVMRNKAALYEKALKSVVQEYPKHPYNLQAWYLLANIDAEKARKYIPNKDTTNRYGFVKALAIINPILPDNSIHNEGSANLRNLLNEIQQKEISIQTEQVNSINKPFRALVNYKNIDTLYYRIYILNEDSIERREDEISNSELSKMNRVASVAQWLPKTYDNQQHSVEIKIDGLLSGKYLLVYKTTPFINTTDAQVKDSARNLYLNFITLHISNIGYITHQRLGSFVVDRETGEPLKNILVNAFNWNDSLIASTTSNREGFFSFWKKKSSEKEDNLYVKLQFKTAKDSLFIEREYGLKKQYETTKKELKRAYFFTDRAIYRPGQTLFFKTITIKSKDSQHGSLYFQKEKMVVYLKDDNSQIIDSIYCQQNDYGSIAGKFQLPSSGLTGQFSINLKNIEGYASFSVEEYKRPNFSISLVAPSISYRLYDTIKIKGSATAFSGNTLDNAFVNYTIIRRSNYENRWENFGDYYEQDKNSLIQSGEAITDANGKFQIQFLATPDSSIPLNKKNTFDYTIEVNLTDKGGETRNENIQVTVGYQSVNLSINAPEIALANDWESFEINTNNYARIHQAAKVGIKIYPLITPERIIRNSYWKTADQFVLSRKEYETYFPFDDYANDLKKENWKLSEPIINAFFNTDSSTIFHLPKQLPLGYYKIVTTTDDKSGTPIKEEQFIQLFDKHQLAYPQTNFSCVLKNTVAPNGQAEFLTGNAYNKVHVFQQTIRGNGGEGFLYEKPIQFSRTKGIERIVFTPKETDRGGAAIHEIFVKHGRVCTNEYQITVPWSNKELQINYATYRNKTEPGNKEKWTMTVKDNTGGKAAAEIVSTLYDASLDQFKTHEFSRPAIWNQKYFYTSWQSGLAFHVTQSRSIILNNEHENYSVHYDHLHNLDNSNVPVKRSSFAGSIASLSVNDLLANPVSSSNIMIRGSASSSNGNNPLYIVDGVPIENFKPNINAGDIASMEIPKDASSTSIYGSRAANGVIIITTKAAMAAQKTPMVIRKNFNETAFFVPQLHADTSGNYTISFTMPDALTKWKWLSFAHTKDLQFGVQSANIVSQKTMMVQTNAPRFLREGDKLEFTSTISNLSDKELSGEVSLALVDATSNTAVDGWFQNSFPKQYFTVSAKQSTLIKFPLTIPYNYNKPLIWKVMATAGNFSDGEEKTIPIISNRQLVTETMPILLRGDTTINLPFTKLLNQNNGSKTLSNESVTVEYTPNPVWTALQALPYLMEYPYECAEQTFNRFFGNVLASNLVNKHPAIKKVFAKWANDSSVLQSNLYKNEELKQTLLAETPWVLAAQSETQQQKNIALLFDAVKMGNATNQALEKLIQMQDAEGWLPWFKGGRQDGYITNYILIGLGKLNQGGMLTAAQKTKLQAFIKKGVEYLDNQQVSSYNRIIELYKKDFNSKQTISNTEIEYLYMRSFWLSEIPLPANATTAYNYFYGQAKQYWVKFNFYNQSLLGLALLRNNELNFVEKIILPSITQNAIRNNNGVYWKEKYTRNWYESLVEFQTAMIDFIAATNKQLKQPSLAVMLDEMKTWLILQKQTNNWQTTLATSAACYVLLNSEELINQNKKVKINLGATTINTSNATEGLGYIKQRINGDKVNASMGNISVTTSSDNAIKQNKSISYGAVYWQYFEDMDKISKVDGPLSVSKKLFIEKTSSTGKVLTPLNDGDALAIGDKVVTRLVLKANRDMDYIHLKDTRAASLEPENVLSSYKWQDGLGYYEATKDASTNFFISHISSGTYIFDYACYVTHKGSFSSGVASIQCMYAPSFTAHSEGVKVKVR